MSIDWLARLGQQTLEELRALKRDVADVRTLSLQKIEYARRIERRMGESRDDLELMIKAELGGGLANMQNQLESHIQPLRDKFLELDKLAERVSALERHP